jgi:hypothetical protein
MVTHVYCPNKDCPRFRVKKTIVSAEILGMNPNVCPACGTSTVAAKKLV